MPKRTNLFQEVVEIIHRHMAEGATVEASAMLTSRSTGKPREVDVVIRGNQAGYEVVVSVEAIGRSRKADRQWVDEMVGKHADLATSKLILVSEKGFTKDARAAALANEAVPLAPEDLSSDDPARDVVDAVPSLWPKLVTFTPEALSVKFAEPAPDDGWDEDPPIIGIDDGRIVGDLMELAKRIYREKLPELMEQIGLSKLEQDAVRRFTLRVEPQEGEELQIRVDGERKTIYLVNANGKGYALRWLTATGKGEIKVSKVPLKQGRLGEVNVSFGYGEGKVGDRDALLVLTEKDDGGGQLTIRIRPLDGQTASD